MTRQAGPASLRNGGHRWVAVLLGALLPVLLTLCATGAEAAGTKAAEAKPGVTLSRQQAGKGGEITVKGSGWRPDTLLMMLICGRSTPERGVIGGTNSCANAEGRAVTTGAEGGFRKKLPVAEPPVPCPCVVHVATVTGEQATADAVFVVAGHPVAALPKETDGGRLAVLATTRLEGDGGVLTWFGAPPARRLVFTVGNLGSAPVKDPVFRIGTAHGVYAPQWEERQWRGTIESGRKAQIKLPVELSAGAHGDYQVSLEYGGKVLAEQPWGVGRPWGVTLFWILLCLVVPAAVFRIGMAIVDKARPRSSRTPAGSSRTPPRSSRTPARAGRHRPTRWADVTAKLPGLRRRPGTDRSPMVPPTPTPTVTASPTAPPTAALPWFTPDSAPSENRPTTKGHS
ncbi:MULTISPECIES: hypothetical protein [unclassified Streptomyces]|uniref:hypothetical protein n=1 Tax=unclassified Streptomyces TaxID=2593676 RepID=UPI0036E7BA14